RLADTLRRARCDDVLPIAHPTASVIGVEGSRVNDFGFVILSSGLALGLFVAMLAVLEMGRRLGVRRARAAGDKSRIGVGVVDAAVYSLLALLIGFTFSGAAQRYDQRRVIIGDVANAASTTWKRIDVLPDDLQPPIRAAFRHYMDEVIA